MKRLLIAIFLCAIPVAGYAFFGGGGGGGKKLPTGCSDSQIPVYSASTLSWSCGDPGAAGVGTIAGSTGSADNALITANGTGGATIQANVATATLSDAGLLTVPTISSGAGGFTVDADGDAVAKSVTVSKSSGTAGDVGLYEANSTDTDAAGFRGPASMTANTSYRGVMPNARPASGTRNALVWTSSSSAGDGTPSTPYAHAMSFLDLDTVYLALSGGTLTGKLTTATNGTVAGLNLTQSADAPSSPANGDIWVTASGLYARYNGSTNLMSSGTPAFSVITGGTNTNALVIGNSGSLAATGTGTITATAVPVAGITGLGSGVATFLATPSSANFASAITGETGTGAAVFGTSPTFTTSIVTPRVDFGTTGGRVSAASGVVTVAGLGNTNNENITIDLEGAANTATVGSGTGVNLVRLTQGIAFGGNIPVVSKAASATLTVAEMNSSVYVTAAATLTLPEVVASSPSATQVTPGAMVCVYSTGANVVRINPNDADGIVLNGAARATNGVDIYSAGAAGNFQCIQADSASGWTTWGASGTWTAGS